MNHIPLYDGRNIRLTPIDLEKDPQIVANWTCRFEIARRLTDNAAHPLTVFEVKKVFEGMKKGYRPNGRRPFSVHLSIIRQLG